MSRHQLRLAMCPPANDDPYFAEISIDAQRSVYTSAEVFLDNVDASAEGPSRVKNARAVVRMYFDDKHFDLPFADVADMLERARTQLLIGESHVSPD